MPEQLVLPNGDLPVQGNLPEPMDSIRVVLRVSKFNLRYGGITTSVA